MKASYDSQTDTLSLRLKTNARVVESDEIRPGVIVDFDADGNLVSIEILDASTRVTDAHKVEFETLRST